MHTVAEMVLPEWMGVTDMNAQEATETRELTFAELEDVAGGSPLLAVAAGRSKWPTACSTLIFATNALPFELNRHARA